LESLKEVEEKIENLDKCFRDLKERIKSLKTGELQRLKESVKNLRQSCNVLLQATSELIDALVKLEKYYMRVPEGTVTKEKEAVKCYGGVFDWCSPEEFERGLLLFMQRHRDEIDKIAGEWRTRNKPLNQK
jgi:predicted nuclease with TOPRIM domain